MAQSSSDAAAYGKQNDRDLVTVSLADVLVQAVANGVWDLEVLERQTIRSVLREIAAGNSWPASMRAASAIAFIDDAETTTFLTIRLLKVLTTIGSGRRSLSNV